MKLLLLRPIATLTPPTRLRRLLLQPNSNCDLALAKNVIGAVLADDSAAKQEANALAYDAGGKHSFVTFDNADEIGVRKDDGKHFYKVRIKLHTDETSMRR